MGHTNSTANLSLPQFIGTDKPTWLGDVNGAFSAIDSYVGTNDAAVAAAASDANSAISQAAAAVNTANTANTTAGNASTTANNAIGVANTANAIAGTVDTKVGLLADLTTTNRTSIVNAINEVNAAIGTPTAAQVSYDNTGSGLTATNVQAAIDEVAQGGGGSWTLAGSVNGNTPIAIPAGSTEYMVTVRTSGDKGFTFNGLVADLTSTPLDCRLGSYKDASTYTMCECDVTSTEAAVTEIYLSSSTNVVASATVKLYVR